MIHEWKGLHEFSIMRSQKCEYASLSSWEAYRDQQLTTNFEFWIEIFCVPTCFHMKIPKPCLSVHLSVPWEKKSPWLRHYQSYISNWYINGMVFTSTTPWKPRNWIFFFKVWNLNFDLFMYKKRLTEYFYCHQQPLILQAAVFTR